MQAAVTPVVACPPNGMAQSSPTMAQVSGYCGTCTCSNCGTTCGCNGSSLCPRCGCAMTAN